MNRDRIDAALDRLSTQAAQCGSVDHRARVQCQVNEIRAALGATGEGARELISLTPGERDTAAAVLRSFRGRGWVGGWDRAAEDVDAIVAAVNDHRSRCNAIADRQHIGKPYRRVTR